MKNTYYDIRNFLGRLPNPASGLMLLITLLLALILPLTGCLPSVTAAEVSQSNGTTAALNIVTYDENTLTALYEKLIPAVVMIQVTIDQTGLNNPFSFGSPQQRGQGSGFLIDNEGHILTNNHVAGDATKIKVILHDGKALDASLVGTDKENDIALIKVNPSDVSTISPLKMGDSANLKPGQLAIALGSPYGLEGSITAGIVSGTGRSIDGSGDRTIADVIQTDAAINPGNSGGPLLNAAGEVIGINTAIESSSNGIGFCVPINTAKALLPSLLKGGEVKTAWLGISGMDVDAEMAATLSLPVNRGVYIVTVTTDSPAAQAGLRGGGQTQQDGPAAGGDLIVAIDGKNVTTVTGLISYFNSKAPGDKISLSVYRDGKLQTIPVTLGEWPETGVVNPLPSQPYPIPTPGNPETPDSPDRDSFKFGPFQWNWDWNLPFPFPTPQPGN